MYAPTTPLPPRIVDGVNVKRPAFYGDVGGSGWYAEMQYPVRRRLAVVYKENWGRDVYIRPTELILPSLRAPVDLRGIEALFRSFNLVGYGETAETSLAVQNTDRQISAELMTRSAVMLRFATSADAQAALHNSENARMRGERAFRADTAEVNVRGQTAFSLADILLVREQSPCANLEIGKHTFHSLSTIFESSPSKPSKTTRRALSPTHQTAEDDHRVKRHKSERQHHTPVLGEPLSNTTKHHTLDRVGPADPFVTENGPRQAGPLTPPHSATSRSVDQPQGRRSSDHTGQMPAIESLRRFGDNLQLSSHASYGQSLLPPCPAWFATFRDRLLIGHTAQDISSRYPGLVPVHIDDLPPRVKEQLGMEEVRGYRWKVKYETQELWRLGGGYLELSPGG